MLMIKDFSVKVQEHMMINMDMGEEEAVDPTTEAEEVGLSNMEVEVVKDEEQK